MARALQKVNSDSPTEAEVAMHGRVIDALERGETVAAIAKRVHPNDKRARGKLRNKLWRMARHDANFQRAIVDRAKTNLLVGLPATSKAVAGRAARGRIDAAKLQMESTGFHNPRVKHDHSGEITIKLDMPRPTFEQDVVDAEVVDD